MLTEMLTFLPFLLYNYIVRISFLFYIPKLNISFDIFYVFAISLPHFFLLQ